MKAPYDFDAVVIGSGCGGSASACRLTEKGYFVGVMDVQNHVFGYQNMLVCDGAMRGANLGVNPSLTMTALSEHAMPQIPAKTAVETTPPRKHHVQAPLI